MSANQGGNRLVDYLGHMLDAIELVRRYTDGMKKQNFIDDKKTQQAVILNILVIGEAATKICIEHPGFVAEHAQVPWDKMRGMRNRMAHGYFEINLDIVWGTVQESLPILQHQLIDLRQHLDERPSQE